jgi:hypothetical protein
MAVDAATIKDLVRAHRSLDKAAASSTDALIAGFRRAEAQAMKRITELIADAPFGGLGQGANLQRRLAWYFENIPSLEVAQANAAYGKAVERYLETYPRLGKLSSSILKAGGVPADFTRIPKELISALQARDATFFAELNTLALQKLDETFLNSVVVGRSVKGALAAIRGTIEGSYKWGETRGLYEWHAGTYARTANMRFSRQIMKAQADELKLEQFLYIGPVDSKKRPFCLQLVGQAFTRIEIEDLDNGQTGDTFSDGGGFNCRDSWSPIDKKLFDDLRNDPDGGQELVKSEMAKPPKITSKSQKGSSPTPLTPSAAAEPVKPALLAEEPFVASITPLEENAFASWKGASYRQMRKLQYLKGEKLARIQDAYRSQQALSKLGGNLLEVLERRLALIENALNRARPFQGNVYRGMRWFGDPKQSQFDKFVSAKELSFNAISSSSESLETAGFFAGAGDDQIIFRIANKTGVNIGKIDGATTEQEIVLRAQARYRVKSVKTFGPGEKVHAGGSTLVEGQRGAFIELEELI